MIEAAITLPLFLVITFGVIEFGNMFMARYQARDVASSVRDYLQDNPSASSADLQAFVTNLGFGSLKNTGPGEDNNVFTKIKIQSEKTMLTAAQFDALCSGGDVKNWANPWLGGDTADDKNDYYIHICYPYTYNTITPLPSLTGGAIAETKTLNSKALAYITKEISCPADQVLQTVKGGAATCVARDNNYTCPAGQILTGITNGQPNCGVYMPPTGVFGGMYNITMLNICLTGNPFAGNGCSCPWWAPNAADAGIIGLGYTAYVMRYCYR
jgi:hypothetical protein